MTSKAENRRRDARVTFRATAKLKFSGDRVFDDCETNNISVSGVLVDGVKGVECGEKCDLEFHLRGRTSTLVLEMSGEVVRSDKSSVALQFFGVDQDSFCHLQNIVYFNYKNPGELGEGYKDAPTIVDDESLYYGIMDDPSLSDGLLSGGDFDDFFGDDSDEEHDGDDYDDDIIEHVRSRDINNEDDQ